MGESGLGLTGSICVMWADAEWDRLVEPRDVAVCLRWEQIHRTAPC